MSAIRVDGRGRDGVYTVEQRFWGKVDGGEVAECWEWLGTRSNGYGRFVGGGGRRVIAHRWAYESLIGPIPDGLHLDHLCRNRACVNPWHLDPVTTQVNVRRSPITNGNLTHCRRGHPFDAENTYVYTSDDVRRRVCRTCRDARRAEWGARVATREQAAA